MFEYLAGTLTHSTPDKAIIDVHGVGYGICICLSTFERLPPAGQACKLFISFVVREDSQRLYGFFTQSERDFFETLNEISGIGPRTSLALLGHLSLEDLLVAVAHADVKALIKVPGIGKKMAERLILELKDKRQKLESKNTDLPKVGTVVGDAISALIHLGYPASEAQKAVRKAADRQEGELPLADLISLALKK